MMTKVALLGIAGQIGTPLSLLLKTVIVYPLVVFYVWYQFQKSPLVDELSLYDIVHAPGIAIDLNHIDTPAKVTGFLPDNDGLSKALQGASLVVIPAGTLFSFAIVLILLADKTARNRKEAWNDT
jgi:malate dehydrogenase